MRRVRQERRANEATASFHSTTEKTQNGHVSLLTVCTACPTMA